MEGEEAANLFKLAASSEIEKTTDCQQQRNLSTKYQVLCDETAIVGVKKQKVKASGEMEETEIKFTKVLAPTLMHNNFGGFAGNVRGAPMPPPPMQGPAP